jgi:hypothetical protein
MTRRMAEARKRARMPKTMTKGRMYLPKQRLCAWQTVSSQHCERQSGPVRQLWPGCLRPVAGEQ